MHSNVVVSALIFAVVVASPAAAQMTMDMAKVTCDQFVHSKVGPPRLIAAWLSGFYNGKQDKSVIDVQGFQANLSKLEQFCYVEKNFNIPVMQAVEQVIGKGK